MIKDQVERVDLQIVTAEAQRRAEMTTEIFAILKQVEDYAENGKAKKEKPEYCEGEHKDEFKDDEGCKNGLLVLPAGLVGRIRTVAASAKPYFTVEPQMNEKGDFIFPKNQKKPLSPQRGYLLLGLAANKIDFAKLQGDFSHADLRSSNLEGANLNGVNLEGADLSYGKLSNSNLYTINPE